MPTSSYLSTNTLTDSNTITSTNQSGHQEEEDSSTASTTEQGTDSDADTQADGRRIHPLSQTSSIQRRRRPDIRSARSPRDGTLVNSSRMVQFGTYATESLIAYFRLAGYVLGGILAPLKFLVALLVVVNILVNAYIASTTGLIRYSTHAFCTLPAVLPYHREFCSTLESDQERLATIRNATRPTIEDIYPIATNLSESQFTTKIHQSAGRHMSKRLRSLRFGILRSTTLNAQTQTSLAEGIKGFVELNDNTMELLSDLMADLGITTTSMAQQLDRTSWSLQVCRERQQQGGADAYLVRAVTWLVRNQIAFTITWPRTFSRLPPFLDPEARAIGDLRSDISRQLHWLGKSLGSATRVYTQYMDLSRRSESMYLLSVEGNRDVASEKAGIIASRGTWDQVKNAVGFRLKDTTEATENQVFLSSMTRDFEYLAHFYNDSRSSLRDLVHKYKRVETYLDELLEMRSLEHKLGQKADKVVEQPVDTLKELDWILGEFRVRAEPLQTVVEEFEEAKKKSMKFYKDLRRARREQEKYFVVEEWSDRSDRIA
ncbi:MAG: hypothetical protein Q9202_004785 [Teloschistes flavicans]